VGFGGIDLVRWGYCSCITIIFNIPLSYLPLFLEQSIISYYQWKLQSH